MEHQLKYYKDINSHGHSWKLEILQDVETGIIRRPHEIGPVLQGLRLVVQGDQADIDTPIVKTSLEMVFVDAPDLETDRKCGYWEEFYTSSATEYKVVLYKDGNIEWTGYVTPDSFSEDLRYRGSVTIIARDNLGHLQDYDCKASQWANTEGRVQVYSIIAGALNELGIIGMNWACDSANASRVVMSNEWGYGSGLWSQMIDAETLSEMNMYEALEKALYSIGATIRYVGGNMLMVSTIRNVGLASYSFWADVPRKEVAFRAYGHRELSPAARQIEEVIEFDLEKGSTAFSMQVSQYIEEGSLSQMIAGVGGTTLETIPVHEYVNASQKIYVGVANSMLLDARRYALREEYAQERFGQWNDPSVLYVAMNVSRPVRLSTRVFGDGGVKATCKCTVEHPITFFDAAHTILGNMPLSNTLINYSNGATFRITFTPFGSTGKKYYDEKNKSWSSSDKTFGRDVLYNWRTNVLPYTFYLGTEIEVADIPISEAGDLVFEVVSINSEELYTQIPCYGAYARVSGMQIEHVRETEDRSKLTIRTEYSDKNNIKLTRSPDFAPNATAKYSPHYYKNSIVTLSDDMLYHTGEQWKWHDGQPGQPLGVVIHQQMLAYYSKPNNVLTGELFDKRGAFPDFQSLWMWGGREHLLMSGTLNVLTGCMENAVLREFKRYDHMWETWIENEDAVVDYLGGRLELIVHTPDGQDPTLQGLPSWLTEAGRMQDGNTFIISLDYMGNGSGQDRSEFFFVGTACIRVTQRAAGDYSTDYGADYS